MRACTRLRDSRARRIEHQRRRRSCKRGVAERAERRIRAPFAAGPPPGSPPPGDSYSPRSPRRAPPADGFHHGPSTVLRFCQRSVGQDGGLRLQGGVPAFGGQNSTARGAGAGDVVVSWGALETGAFACAPNRRPSGAPNSAASRHPPARAGRRAPDQAFAHVPVALRGELLQPGERLIQPQRALRASRVAIAVRPTVAATTVARAGRRCACDIPR